MSVRTLVLTSDLESWALAPFSYFYMKYYPSAPVLVAGFKPPPFPIPYSFRSLGTMADFPYSKWSDGLIALLNSVPDEIVLLLLEDFWVTRTVDAEAIELLAQFMRENPVVVRGCIGTDRLYAQNLRDVCTYGRLDIITNNYPVAYAMSFQPNLWRRSELLRYLVPNENPHEVEINGTRRMEQMGAVVVGTRNFPMRYLIAVQQHKLTLDGGYQSMKPLLNPDDLAAVSKWIPADHS